MIAGLGLAAGVLFVAGGGVQRLQRALFPPPVPDPVVACLASAAPDGLSAASARCLAGPAVPLSPTLRAILDTAKQKPGTAAGPAVAPVLLAPGDFARLESAAAAEPSAVGITLSPTGLALRVEGPLLPGRIESEFEVTTDDAAKGAVALWCIFQRGRCVRLVGRLLRDP